MPKINFCSEIAHPFFFNYEGKKYYLTKKNKTTALVASIAVGIFTIFFLGVPGIITFYILTFKNKQNMIKVLNNNPNYFKLKENPIKSNNYFHEISSQNFEEIIAAIELIERTESAVLDTKQFSQIEINRTLHLARYFLRYDTGKRIPNAQGHLKILECIIKITQKQKKLIEFVLNHPIENRQEYPQVGFQNASAVNHFLARELGIVFHHEEQDAASILKEAPDFYVKAFLYAWKKEKIKDFIEKVFQPSKWACFEGNYKSLILWTNKQKAEEGKSFDLESIPDINLKKQTLDQILGAFYISFQNIKLTEYLQKHPEKKQWRKEKILYDKDFFKYLNMKDFIEYLKKKENQFLPLEAKKEKNSEAVIKIDENNIEEIVRKFNEIIPMFSDDEEDEDEKITEILQKNGL